MSMFRMYEMNEGLSHNIIRDTMIPTIYNEYNVIEMTYLFIIFDFSYIEVALILNNLFKYLV